MKVGDLVRHRFDGRWDEVGIAVKITPRLTGVPGGMVSVLWNVEHSHRNDRLHRLRHLEVVSESW
jgi:hypothetical protein